MGGVENGDPICDNCFIIKMGRKRNNYIGAVNVLITSVVIIADPSQRTLQLACKSCGTVVSYVLCF